MGLGQYNSLGEYCGLSTVSEVFLIIISIYIFSYNLFTKIYRLIFDEILEI